MAFEQQEMSGVQVVRPTGRLDGSNAPEFERALQALLAAGTTKLLLDLGQLDFISSAGMRVVLMAGKGLRARQGRMALSGVHGMVKEIFEVSGFLSLFEVAADAEAGVKLLAA